MSIHIYVSGKRRVRDAEQNSRVYLVTLERDGERGDVVVEATNRAHAQRRAETANPGWSVYTIQEPGQLGGEQLKLKR